MSSPPRRFECSSNRRVSNFNCAASTRVYYTRAFAALLCAFAYLQSIRMCVRIANLSGPVSVGVVPNGKTVTARIMPTEHLARPGHDNKTGNTENAKPPTNQACGVGRRKPDLKRWGYLEASSTPCEECGEEQTMDHLLECSKRPIHL